MIAPDMEKSASHLNVSMLKSLIDEKLIEAIEVVDDAVKEGVKSPLLNLEGNTIVDFIQQAKVDLLLMSNSEGFTKFDRFMNALGGQMHIYHWLIKPRKTQVKSHMKNIEEEHRLAQRLQHQLVESTCQHPLETPKVENAVVKPHTGTPSQTDSDKEH